MNYDTPKITKEVSPYVDFRLSAGRRYLRQPVLSTPPFSWSKVGAHRIMRPQQRSTYFGLSTRLTIYYTPCNSIRRYLRTYLPWADVQPVVLPELCPLLYLCPPRNGRVSTPPPTTKSEYLSAYVSGTPGKTLNFRLGILFPAPLADGVLSHAHLRPPLTKFPLTLEDLRL